MRWEKALLPLPLLGRLLPGGAFAYLLIKLSPGTWQAGSGEGRHPGAPPCVLPACGRGPSFGALEWLSGAGLAGLPQAEGEVVAALGCWLGAVRDALDELQQALAGSGDPHWDVLEEEEAGSRGDSDVRWSEVDRQLLGPCLGLVKAAKACLKKLLGVVKAWGEANTAEQVAQLEDLKDAASDISPSVDELVLSTYPPVNQLTLRLNAAKLAAVLKKTLETARASCVCPPSEESWVQFLAGAVDHNMEKIKGFTQGVL